MKEAQKIPVGLIVVLVFMGMAGAGTVNIVSVPILQFGSIIIKGAGAIAIALFMTAIYATGFYGLLKRYSWGRNLAIFMFAFSAILSVINTLYLYQNPSVLDTAYEGLNLPPEALEIMTDQFILGLVTFSATISIGIGLFVVIYLIRKKAYFKA